MLVGLAHHVRQLTRPQFGAAIDYRDIELRAVIAYPGSKEGFSLTQRVEYIVHVTPSSSARIRERILAGAEFTSLQSREQWKADGRPALPRREGGEIFVLAQHAFGFNPQGRSMTYAAVLRLPTTAEGTVKAVRDALRPLTLEPSPPLLLKQFGYLLANGPLTRGSRAAILEAIGKVPTAAPCGDTVDAVGRRGYAICTSDRDLATALLLNPETGVALSLTERLRRASASDPGMRPGAILTSDTFVRG